MMRKYVLKIILFFTIVAIVDVCVSGIGNYLQTHSKGGDTRRTNDLLAVDRHDVLILGSSRAHHHYDTPFLSDTLGLDVYNAGYDGNGVVLATGVLEMTLERYKPKLVLFDVEPAFDINVYDADNHHVRYISWLKPYYRHAAIGGIIRDVSEEDWYKAHSGMMRYNTSVLVMCRDYLFGSKDSLRGYAAMKGIYTGEPSKESDDAVVDTFKLGYIEKLIQVSQSNGVPIILVASPKYTLATSEVLQPVKEICGRYGVDFLDYYNDSSFTMHKEWFKEPMHLNAVGARVFSKEIAGRISNRL